MYCFVILLLFNEMQMSVRRFSAIPHLRANSNLDQTASSYRFRCLKFYLPSILFRGQGMQKRGDIWLQVSNLLMYYFLTDHRETY